MGLLTYLKTDYELDYWKGYVLNPKPEDINNPKDMNTRYLTTWGVLGRSFGKTLDIGCGPLSGLLSYVDATDKHAIEPLLNEYREFGVFNEELGKGVTFHVERIEDSKLKTKFDTIFAANVLDHGDSSFSSIDVISKLLKKGGRLYIHVHLRKESELNIGHDHALKEEDLLAKIESNKLKVIMHEVFDQDPVELGVTYHTLIGVYEK